MVFLNTYLDIIRNLFWCEDVCIHINMYYVPIYDICFLFKNQRGKSKKNQYSPESNYLEIATQHFKPLSQPPLYGCMHQEWSEF